MPSARTFSIVVIGASLLTGPLASAASVRSSGITQCLRASGARFQNTADDTRLIRLGARTWRLGISKHVRGVTVDVWVHKGRDGYRHRVYLLRPGLQRLFDRHTASQEVLRSFGNDWVLFDSNSWANHHSLDGLCLKGRGTHRAPTQP